MAKVRSGYQLHVVDGEGVLQGTVELAGYDLYKGMAVWQLAGDISALLPHTAFESAFESESKTEEG